MNNLVYMFALVGAITVPIVIGGAIAVVLAIVTAPRRRRTPSLRTVPIARAVADRRLELPSQRPTSRSGAIAGPSATVGTTTRA